MGEDDFLEAQYEDRNGYPEDEGWGEYEEDEADAWTVVDRVTGAYVRGPFGTSEQAQEACDAMAGGGRYVVAPVYY